MKKWIKVLAILGPIVLFLSYKAFLYRQRLNEIKSVLAQAKVADMGKLSSYGFINPLYYPIYTHDGFYFEIDSCCSEQQFGHTSHQFYKAAESTPDGRTYQEWVISPLQNYLPEQLLQGSFGEANLKVQGKSYYFMVVNDTRANRTTILIFPEPKSADNSG